MIIKGKNFIFTGLQPWDIPIGSNAKDIAFEIAKNNKVLYVNTPNNRNSKYILTQITETLWSLDIPVRMIPINGLPDNFIFDAVNYINQKRTARYIKKAIKELQMHDYILFTDNDIYNSFFLCDLLSPLKSIYYKRDFLTGKYWGRHVNRLEPLICKKYDIIMTNSIPYADSVKMYNPKSEFIGQGLDLEKYNVDASLDVPTDILPIKRPIIGYVGLLAHFRLDMDIIYDMANELKDYSFVLVGKETAPFEMHKVHTLPNIYFLGEKKESEVRNYIKSFDICINPQVVTDITNGNYPRKIDEYLALGKPVVASRTKAMEYFDGYVECCSNSGEYVDAIKKLVESGFDSGNIQKRVDFAKSHSWSNCVGNIYKILKRELD